MNMKRNTSKLHQQNYAKRQREARSAYNEYTGVTLDHSMDDTNKAVDVANENIARKLSFLTEASHMSRPARGLPRRRGPVGATNAVGGGGGGGGGSGGYIRHRRGHNHNNNNSNKVTLDELGTARDSRHRLKSGYNVYLDSPRRNGLTPRASQMQEEQAEAALAAISGGGNKQRQHDTLKTTQLFGRPSAGQMLNAKPLNTYVHEHSPVYSCSLCGAKFQIKSLLGAHRRTHDDDFKVRFKARRKRGSSTVASLPAGNQCKYCDRKFDLERTLHIHQLCHCKKIPPQQRRKLGYTELLHEKKAPLPSFQRQGGGALNHATLGAHAIRQQQEQHNFVKTVVANCAPVERWR
ncbi:uncharacterized protein LOC115627692 [Scaptodrosophila lebanonensis]|uniref:Uncharacterized protein LOC115627692 n=1 Tax=Drosophila lebanonensis TaxID=7225 RepID=A0A6J2TUN1_DROLE|nr:uncharacterized protein LOC115627692 [Scaptodrosophila lebanonensis]